MLTIRAILEACFIICSLCLFTFTLLRWDLLNCSVPFNIWLLIFSLLNISTRSLFLLVSILPTNYILITISAYSFLFFLNPLIIICTVAGIILYITLITRIFICGSLLTTWIIIICLAIGLTNSVMAVLQSIRIYRSFVRFIKSYLRTITFRFPTPNLSESLNDPSMTHEELSRLPAVRASGLVIGSECVICHERIIQDEFIRQLPGCVHTFHQICIDNWLSRSPTCPLCRNNVRMSIL